MTTFKIIDKLNTTRGTVFMCQFPGVKDISLLGSLVGQSFTYENEKWLVKEEELLRGGIVSRPSDKKTFALLAEKVL